jgi:Rrf2 family protein
MFSRTFGYALRAVVYLATHTQPGSRIGLQELSAGLDVPHHFLGKIMQDLVRHGVIHSAKGPSGGFYPTVRTAETRLIEVLRITDGQAPFNTCVLGIKYCNAERPCPLHREFSIYREGLLRILSEKSIGDLARSIEGGDTFLSGVLP